MFQLSDFETPVSWQMNIFEAASPHSDMEGIQLNGARNVFLDLSGPNKNNTECLSSIQDIRPALWTIQTQKFPLN